MLNVGVEPTEVQYTLVTETPEGTAVVAARVGELVRWGVGCSIPAAKHWAWVNLADVLLRKGKQ